MVSPDRHYRELFEMLPAASLLVGPGGRIIEVNRAAVDMLGYSHDELCQMTVVDLRPPEWRESARQVLANLKRGETIRNQETAFLRPDGSLVYGLLSAYPRTDDAGGFLCAQGVVINLSQQRMAERRARHVSNVLSSAIADLAHELRNPLMGLLNYIQYCRELTSDDDERAELLGKAEWQARRCAALVGDMRGRMGMRPFTEEDVHVPTVIRSALDLVAMRLEELGIELEIDLDDALPPVRGRHDSFEQVLLNLLENAIDAVESCPERRITIRGRSLDDVVKLTVRDTGTGIADTVRTRLFDPFFSTKPDGRGSGLGLSVCRRIVSAMGGSLRAENSPTGGAELMLTLPAATAGAITQTPPQQVSH